MVYISVGYIRNVHAYNIVKKYAAIIEDQRLVYKQTNIIAVHEYINTPAKQVASYQVCVHSREIF